MSALFEQNEKTKSFATLNVKKKKKKYKLSFLLRILIYFFLKNIYKNLI